MKTIDPKKLAGKTISSVHNRAINCWLICFTDETSVVIDTEPGPAGIAALTAYKPTQEMKNQMRTPGR